MKISAIINETLRSRWFWLPMLVVQSLILSAYLTFAFGLLGTALAWYWVYPMFIKEELRLDRLIRKKLFKSEAWEITTQQGNAAIKDYVALVQVDKEKPSNPSPLKH